MPNSNSNANADKKERISVLESNINLNANFSQLKLLLSIIKIIEIKVSKYFPIFFKNDKHKFKASSDPRRSIST